MGDVLEHQRWGEYLSDAVSTILATIGPLVTAVLATVPPPLDPVHGHGGRAYDGRGPHDRCADHSPTSGTGWT
jgi:hypothetical protein